MDQMIIEPGAIVVAKPQIPLALLVIRNAAGAAFGAVFAAIGLFLSSPGAMDGGTCRLNGKVIPCSEMPKFFPYIFLGIGLVVMIAAIFAPFVQMIAQKHTCWAVYKDKITYCDGFLNQEIRTLQRDKIIGVSMVKGVVQRMFGLGSIWIESPLTNASLAALQDHSRQSGLRINGVPVGGPKPVGICMKDVKNPDRVFDAIKKAYGL